MKRFCVRTIKAEYLLQTIHGTSSDSPHHPWLKAIWQPQMIKAAILTHSKHQWKTLAFALSLCHLAPLKLARRNPRG